MPGSSATAPQDWVEPEYPFGAPPETVNGLRIPDQRAVVGGRPLGGLVPRMGILYVEVSAEHSVAVMPVEGNTQPIGLVHGGAYCVLGESLGSISAFLHAQQRFGGSAVGVDINATHTRAAATPWVTADCRAIHLGGSTAVHEIVVVDGEGRRCSTLRITNLLLRPGA